MITVLETDVAFRDSPEEGHAACRCSRCFGLIGAYEFALRCWRTRTAFSRLGRKRKVTDEWRFCQACQAGMGIEHFPDAGRSADEEFDDGPP